MLAVDVSCPAPGGRPASSPGRRSRRHLARLSKHLPTTKPRALLRLRETDEDIKVDKGDVVVTGGGASHSVRNGGHTPLKILAFIVTH